MKAIGAVINFNVPLHAARPSQRVSYAWLPIGVVFAQRPNRGSEIINRHTTTDRFNEFGECGCSVMWVLQ
jgi:hypothetical protein